MFCIGNRFFGVLPNASMNNACRGMGAWLCRVRVGERSVFVKESTHP